MTNSNEALEATAKALSEDYSPTKPWDTSNAKQRTYWLGKARTVLKAAMPHIRREIADELREASEVWYEFDEEAAEGLRYAADLVDEKEA